MRRTTDNALQLSATDLSQFLGCQHRTGLELAVSLGQRSRPDWVDPLARILRERGLSHERGYVDSLREVGLQCVDLTDYQGQAAVARTLEALHAGMEVVVQGALAEGSWFGRPDVLRRIDPPSSFGAWSYQVIDTKLAMTTAGGTILQLALYSDLLSRIQGVIPEDFLVVTPDSKTPVQSFRTQDYLAYYRLVRRQLETAAARSPESILAEVYPEPVDHCDVCQWWQGCQQRRRQDDHLSFVAGLRKSQQRELERHEITTLATLAGVGDPLPFKPRRGAADSYRNVRDQARLQFQGRTESRHLHELLPITAEHGFTRLPEPCVGDVFLDLEGDPFVTDGGREYLFGLVYLSKAGEPVAVSHWGWSRADERLSFEAVMDQILELWKRHSGMHVYHYAPYEPTAFKRLMGRYATHEEGVDRLLRAERFIDLHAVVRQSLRASVERYSIKDLEPFYGYTRKLPLAEARTGLRVVERAIELNHPLDPDSPEVQAVRDYNLDDCLSALALRNWLESLRAEAIAQGAVIDRPELKDGAASEEIEARDDRASRLIAALIEDLPVDPAQFDADQRAQWIAAQLLGWHRREGKAPAWEFFRLRDLSDEDLTDERAAITGLTFLKRTASGRTSIDNYGYPAQEVDVRPEFQVFLPGADEAFGTVESIDSLERVISIKRSGAATGEHPAALFSRRPYISTKALEDALFRIGEDILKDGITGRRRFQAARALLRRKLPTLTGTAFEQLPDESAVDFAVRIAPKLYQTVLPIQGPPGAGKTYTGAKMICALIAMGLRVGVTANSHDAVRNLMRKVLELSEGAIRCVRKISKKGESDDGIEETSDNKRIEKLLQRAEPVLIGGTHFLWARPELEEKLDVLFIDEAGQLSLANSVAASQGTKNLVLLGDPQQLEQPQQGSHPDGTAVSALEHILQEHQTIPPERGIFLPETWRLAPRICEFTSEVFYESRLTPRAENRRQVIGGTSALSGAGLWVLPVAHEGNQNSSPEEVSRIEKLVVNLLKNGRWTNKRGETGDLQSKDIMVVAPYNAQVALLTTCLQPLGVRAGTVDKFQGQEAPVVIYSMATSSPEEAPRGMEFLYSLNRLNVASSRAQCACVLVASSRLFSPECKTPRQMQLANALCRYLEMAAPLDEHSGSQLLPPYASAARAAH